MEGAPNQTTWVGVGLWGFIVCSLPIEWVGHQQVTEPFVKATNMVQTKQVTQVHQLKKRGFHGNMQVDHKKARVSDFALVFFGFPAHFENMLGVRSRLFDQC